VVPAGEVFLGPLAFGFLFFPRGGSPTAVASVAVIPVAATLSDVNTEGKF
jgi:hypothetical protein